MEGYNKTGKETERHSDKNVRQTEDREREGGGSAGTKREGDREKCEEAQWQNDAEIERYGRRQREE